MKIIHGAVTVEETTAAVSIPEGKTNMINVDYVGKKIIGQRTTVIVFFCGISTHIKRNCPWNKRTDSTNVIRMCSTNETKCFNVELILNVKLVTTLLDSGSSFSLTSLDSTRMNSLESRDT